MSRNETPALDELILSNDIVKLLGADNQRLKRELREAQQKASNAEAKLSFALAKNESKDTSEELAAADRVRQVLQEKEELESRYEREKEVHEAHFQEWKSKYKKEKEERNTLKSQLDACISNRIRFSIEEHPEFPELQRRQAQTQAELAEANSKVQGLLQQVEQMTRDKHVVRRIPDAPKLSEVWAFIMSIQNRPASMDITIPIPVMKDDSEQYETVNELISQLKRRKIVQNPVFELEETVSWFMDHRGIGIALYPFYKYTPDDSSCMWTKTTEWDKFGTFELLRERHGFWYYYGTYTSWKFVCCNDNTFFTFLPPVYQMVLLDKTLEGLDEVSPRTFKEISDSYALGTLPVLCIGLERIGFNQQLCAALCEHGKLVDPPLYSSGICPETTTSRRTASIHSEAARAVKRPRVESPESSDSSDD
ncbi:uncharacterized protein FOMMEDRAFT_161035 [Fomitiporia mediterranea MF3/22]|uniref:uncharacterized protein n=1 Tax=Fomitiporia mediterranea (strain MF3/22) TaxID=694068 RepID=UPI00044087EE|nr:uncharacterized protein FOMMEDRAFT_161035 [Fomitiporia mediterranea MF3/22]EJC98856.1 hypothetical protein FOMMEDRAFT_161035 [Fomitiporia mediterranea MF3/22]